MLLHRHVARVVHTLVAEGLAILVAERRPGPERGPRQPGIPERAGDERGSEMQRVHLVEQSHVVVAGGHLEPHGGGGRDPLRLRLLQRHFDRPARILGRHPLVAVGKPRHAVELDRLRRKIPDRRAESVPPRALVGNVLRVGVGHHRELVAEAVLIVAGPRQRAAGNRRGARLLVLGMPPAAVDGVDDRRRREGPRAVAEGVDAVLHDDGEVLVAAEMDSPSPLDEPEGGVAARLRPAVAVEVGEQPLIGLAVHVHRAAEGGLREHPLGPHAGRVLRPAVEPGELPRAQQLEAGKIDRRAVIRRIGDVVGPRPECGDRALGARLELPVFEDREVEPAEHEPREIDRDPLLHRRGVHRVGQMPGLLSLHHVHVGGRIIKPAVGAGLLQGPLAVGAPEVGMAHVVVVGDRHGRPITEHVAEL